ncbi:cell wall-binding repeat-containing protein [Clostridium sp. PL3]|uniref:Cell wall-binding repeat-containing protein n=1 Tax=Clostridium thailandense TaxID=2794346 RepID=A0A949X4L4_9CLOT|nr:cell wall-binding repeat-containing protein [Clostridium thailandense]MBV7276709.1 cell wall-binding repeat-containing protein [Clostridium thailandense]
MRIKNYVLGLFITVGILFSMNPIIVFADSPLTSTNFYKAYTDVNIVKKAEEKGIINQEIANYLHSSTNPIDVKAAVINALGWNFDGKSNAKSYVSLIYSKDIDKLDMQSLSGDELFCISYMMALDNYFDVNKAESLMEKAYEKNRTSFTIAIVRSIIKGQASMSGDWGMVWTNTESVLNDKTLVKEMRQGAIDIIVEYMKLYEKYSTNTTDTVIATNRIFGSNRYETSAKICEEGWKQSDYVVIASGEAFPDSLSAAPLAKKYNAPILLNTHDSLLSQVSSEIDRLQAKHAILIGGLASLSSEVENAIKAKGLDIIRLSGATRYETSIEIAKKIGTSNGVIVTTGEDYGDALSIAPIAGKLQMPIILAQKDVLNSVQEQFISNNSIPITYVLGYTDIISDAVASKFPNVQRIGGDNKYIRNLNIIDTFSKEIDFSKSILTSGKDFPDALSGSAFAALNNSPIFLIGSGSYNGYEESSNNISIATLLRNNKANTLYTLGGNANISDDTLNDIVNRIK